MGIGTHEDARTDRKQVRSSGGEGGRFRRELRTPGLTLLTLGGVMGSGIFLASGLVIQHAGPAALVVFAVAAVGMYLEIMALAEMSAADPTPGSFLVYSARVLGPGFTFVGGWIYWFSSVLTMSSEVTAASLFMQLWFPNIPIWIWAFVYSTGVVGINFLAVRGFGQIEAVMAGVKTLAIAGFVVLGISWALGLVRSGPTILPLWSNLSRGGPFWPHGVGGAAPALLLALFAFAGTGVIGMAAAETREPSKTIPQAARQTVLLVTVLYLVSIFFVLELVPWSTVPTTHSPFVAAVAATGIAGLGTVMNVALLFAVLSTMNAALYANVRVLYSLARQGQAPKSLGRLNRQGQPTAAIWTSAALLGMTIILAYVLPHKAYSYLVTATGFQAMFVWLMILWTQIHYRPYLEHHHPNGLPLRLRLYPYSTIACILLVVLALAFSPLASGELVGAIVGFGGICVAALVWIMLRHRLRRSVQD